jgi:hypothetical protein
MRFNLTARESRNAAKDDKAFFKSCVRFNKHKVGDKELANVYANLREQGIVGVKAISQGRV